MELMDATFAIKKALVISQKRARDEITMVEYGERAGQIPALQCANGMDQAKLVFCPASGRNDPRNMHGFVALALGLKLPEQTHISPAYC
ncbi:hypothetical protein [Cupriavidus sp. D39]|uniref:hypothetical protein n=1 Tax=Cupriavidus sp. D39 TaxID=2997877 RepID=UPI00226D9002|nr:hypothetical protein [Cupriavidus sp. D39]MCY0853636.1 hypothetical protein [Cupriavidus sp. D39]